MVVYSLAGRADDPFFREVEDLASYISAELPDISIKKYMVHPEDWASFYADTTKKLGFVYRPLDVLIWTDTGRLIGDQNDFSAHCHEYYKAKIKEPFETYVKIAEENMASATFLKKEGKVPKVEGL
eukprot:CAMPEP_0113901096 /NCGR_PEP_ID=MMETSP0780_2-20120614/21056_1 /TAXON_ID=652834 /ORGANISM="Palpitomonas bilix" /LENGTH=125 /DNA_ID=CAMNT_0000893655 /DNA_START=555 /DNA_END=933 /DNA_ORIENTATION=- /assembly_acc=CAM_ASM_000599